MRPTPATSALLSLLLATACTTSATAPPAADLDADPPAAHLGPLVSTLNETAPGSAAPEGLPALDDHPRGTSTGKPAEAADAASAASAASAAGAAGGAGATAASTVIDLLEAEGLTVFELDTELEQLTTTTAVVSVSVLHGSGSGYPHDTRYRITLTRTDRRGWQPNTLEPAP
jgi:hypothetical protein